MAKPTYPEKLIKAVQLVLEGVVALVFLIAGILNFSGTMTDEMDRLGYPGYFGSIIGVAYIIGVICIYQPRYDFLRDWAFGSMAAALVGAVGTHVLVGDHIGSAMPAVLTLLVLLIAYALRKRVARSQAVEVHSTDGRHLPE